MGLLLPFLGDDLPVVITELGPPFRVVTFAGPDRPEPVRRVSRARVVQTWYPGAKQASVQQLGIEQEPIVLRGWLRDPLSVLLGDGPQARLAILRGLQEGGRQCWLLWGDTINLTGRVEILDYTTVKMNKIQYEITFAVDKSDEFSAPLGVSGVATAGSQVAETAVEVAGLFEDALDVVSTANALGAFVPG